MTKLKPHPYCLIFPPMTTEEFNGLRQDISLHGQHEPIITFDGKILDGRSRYNAVMSLGKKPYFKPFDGTAREALRYAVSKNLYRRHLSQSQKAAVAAEIERWLVAMGMSEKSASRAAKRVSGAAPRSIAAFKRIEAASPKLAAKIADGRETIGSVERRWEAPSPLQIVTRELRDARAAARRALAVADKGELPEELAHGIMELCNLTQRLIAKAEAESELAAV